MKIFTLLRCKFKKIFLLILIIKLFLYYLFKMNPLFFSFPLEKCNNIPLLSWHLLTKDKYFVFLILRKKDMSLKHFALITAFILLFTACNNDNDEKKNRGEENDAMMEQTQPPQQMNRQPQNMGQQRQMGMQQQKQQQTGQKQQMQPGQMPGQQQPQQGQKLEVSDAELKKFANAAQQVQMLSQQSQQQMVSAVQEEGLDIERFNEIHQAQQNPQQKSNATDAEMKKFTAAMNQIQTIQNNTISKIQQKISDNGLTENRYQQISQAMQTDTSLQQRLQAIFQQEQQGQPSPQGK